MKGFTIVEILVTVALMTILSLAFIPSYNISKQQLAVQRSANKLAQDIRLVMEGAMSAVEKSSCSGGSTYKHGIYLENNSDKYVLFADCNGNNTYQPSDVLIKEEYFEAGVKIYSLNSANEKIHIVFEPPDPSVYIDGPIGGNTAIIKIQSNAYIDKTRTITINKVGLVDVD